MYVRLEPFWAIYGRWRIHSGHKCFWDLMEAVTEEQEFAMIAWASAF